MKIKSLLLLIGTIFCLANFVHADFNDDLNLKNDPYSLDIVQSVQDTLPPLQYREGDYLNDASNNPFELRDPKNVTQRVEYDAKTGRYMITESMGNGYFRMPTYMTFEEYTEYRRKQDENDYFNSLAGVGKTKGELKAGDDPLSKVDVKESLRDRLFGDTNFSIKPQGNVDLTFGVDFQRTQNPARTIRQQRTGGFDFDMDIEMSVEASIGKKLKMSTNYNTQSTLDFQNMIKLDYDANAFTEDDIIKTIELGNVSFPLRSSLIRGSQSLLGIHTELQFAKLKLGIVASKQQSQRQSKTVQGGSQVEEFEVRADEYDENRHFFLTHYNRDHFEEALSNLPQIKSLFKVTRMEVWITNDRNEVENIRDVVAIADMGEPTKLTNQSNLYGTPLPTVHPDIEGNPLPGFDLQTNVGANNILTDLIANSNASSLDQAVATLNGLGFQQSRDYEKVSARLLSPNEYSFNADLGTLSLNVNLRPDQVLGVAFEYDYNGKTYQVGELTKEGAGNNADGDLTVLFVKMLKSTTQRTGLPTWDLMMKNIYNIGAFQVNKDDFVFDIFYDDPGKSPKRYIPERPNDPLLRIFNLDRLNVQGDPYPDGIFDFVPGVTINTRNGRIMFPVLEPFAESLQEGLANLNPPFTDTTYLYPELYDMTITQAREFASKNRFVMKGSYKSSISSDISLGAFNLPPGSVTVRAGGRVLVAGQDYDIDYNIGRVKIINEGILNSGTPIDISYENNALFSIQSRTMIGLRADYEVNKHLNIGGTYMRLFERPFTQKVNVGDDPINNRVVGFDVNYNNDAPFITKMVDAIPFIDTKEPSSISFTAEVAGLKPSHAKAINVDGSKSGGTVYIDDFEGASSNNDLRTPVNRWFIASVPQFAENGDGQALFPESQLINDLASGANRAKTTWYRIDQTLNPGNDDPYTMSFNQDEVFPGRAISNFNPRLLTFDLTYYPRQRGPYNFDVPGGTAYSSGLDNQGQLLAPEERWGGIMRALNTNDFQAANIEYLEFWVLNPFINSPQRQTNTQGGDLYIDLGNISEDILRDSRKIFENGIPTDPDVVTDQTNWSKIPRTNAVTNAFDSDPAKRALQDIGLDGYNSQEEVSFYEDYYNAINSSSLVQSAKDLIFSDVANDDFVNFNSSELPENANIFERYYNYNNTEGNSGPPANGIVNSSTNLPDTEDLNNDNTLSETESYFSYRVPLTPTAIPGPSGEIELDEDTTPYISDIRRIDNSNRVWYRFKIPLNGPGKKAINGIQDFRSIRFMRMYMTNFRQPVTLRFASMELVRNQWRRYTLRGVDTNPCAPDAPECQSGASFEVNAVNFEENQGKVPFAYQLPPGIAREQSVGNTTANQFQNEQSITLEVQNLEPDYSVGAYKIINMDWRMYENMNMFVHAEAFDNDNITGVPDTATALFIRIGSDFEDNYYEYEVPLEMSTDVNGDAYEIWKPANAIDIALSQFKDLKVERNKVNFSINNRYEKSYNYEYEPNPGSEKAIKTNYLYVKGNPNLAQVKGVMLGIRNKSGENQSIEVWANELRLSGINEKGGVAALARADIQLADFGDVTVAANYNSIGWGQLEDNVMDRAREETLGYDMTTNLQLGKFFPEQSGIKVPFFAQYSKTTSTPQYDPYDQDLSLKESLATADNSAQRDSIKERALDVTTIKSWNLTNVRKERNPSSTKKPMPWNIENFDASYSYTNTEINNPIIEKDVEEVREGRLNYRYAPKDKYFTPFKKLSKSKYLKLITDFNFNPVPNTIAVSNNLTREFQQTRYRFIDDGGGAVNKEFFNKQFKWSRNYDFKWNLTKNLKMNYNAKNEAVVDELPEIDTDGSRPTNDAKKEFMWDNVKDFGRNKLYSQRLDVDYKLPLKRIPFLDWIQASAKYSSDYSWTAAALNTLSLGNIIQNNQTRKLDIDANFEKLYRKSDFLSKVNKKPRRKNRKSKSKKPKDLKGGKEELKKKDTSKKKKKKKGDISKGTRMAVRPLLLLRKARLTYSQRFSTVIPGFMPSTNLFGMDQDFSAPGWDFVAGLQPNLDPYAGNDYLTKAANNGWISSDIFLNQQVIQNSTEEIDAKVTLEPFDEFNIDFTATRKYTDNQSFYFKNLGTAEDVDFGHKLPRQFGSYEISYFNMNTLFNGVEEVFTTFLNNREIISQRLGNGEHAIDGVQYSEGYGRVQQNVVLPAFISAYTDQDPNTTKLEGNYAREVLFKQLPKLNWTLRYRGLSKVPFFSDIFSSFNLTHGYRSTLQVNSFLTNQRFNYDTPTYINEPTGNFITRFEIPELVINEQFVPVLGIDARLQNGMTFKADFKKSRTLALSLQDNSINETRSDEYVIGWGYRMKDVHIGFLKGGKKKKGKGKSKSKKNSKSKNAKREVISFGKSDPNFTSDLNFAFDFGFRNNRSFRNSFDNITTTTEPTRGAKIITINPAIDYDISEQLNARLFVDYSRNIPATTAQFPTTNIAGGIRIRFKLN